MTKYLLLGLVFGGLWLWRRGHFNGPSGMTAQEAARLLDIPVSSDLQTINAAHKRLISRVHPDTGGSAELASRVNQARDILLQHQNP